MNYIIANTVIILFFLLSPLNAHYFSESFSKWNVVDNKVEANFSLLTLESTRIFQVENYQKIMFEENLSETDVFKIYLSQHLKVTSEGKNCSLIDEIKDLWKHDVSSTWKQPLFLNKLLASFGMSLGVPR